MPLIWDIRRRRYRDTDSGRLLGAGQVRRTPERSLVRSDKTLEELAHGVARGQIFPEFFNARAREEIKDTYARQYILGKGDALAT